MKRLPPGKKPEAIRAGIAAKCTVTHTTIGAVASLIQHTPRPPPHRTRRNWRVLRHRKLVATAIQSGRRISNSEKQCREHKEQKTTRFREHQQYVKICVLHRRRRHHRRRRRGGVHAVPQKLQSVITLRRSGRFTKRFRQDAKASTGRKSLMLRWKRGTRYRRHNQVTARKHSDISLTIITSLNPTLNLFLHYIHFLLVRQRLHVASFSDAH